MLLSEISDRLGLAFSGPDRDITGVNTLESAVESELSFLVNPKYAKQLKTTKAGAVLLPADRADDVASALISENVYMDLAQLVSLFAVPQGSFTGQSEMAFIDSEAQVHESATVYPFAYIGAGAVVGAHSVVFPQCYVGERSVIGTGCLLYPGCVLMSDTELGDGCILQPGVVLGGDGFGFAQTPMGHMKIPQIGKVTIGDNVEVGSNSTIDRAALDVTSIGSGSKIDNVVQIGHNCRIGEHALIVALTGIGGSTKIGDGVVIGGQAGIKDNIEIGDGCMIGGKAGINSDLPAGSKMTFNPMMDISTYLRTAASLPKLPQLMRRVRKLEKQLANLQDDGGSGE